VTAILEARGVTKRFGGVVAVKGVDLDIRERSITSVIGPNGAGKTSLFNVVTGFERPDAGTISFRGERVERLEPWRLAARGMVRSFQTPVGFPALSVWENLMVAGTSRSDESLRTALVGGWRGRETETHEHARDLLEHLDLWSARDSLLRDLPPGDVKLVDFARQLMARPSLLLLDEPASGVDPRAIGRLAGLIRRVRADRVTILVIDHNIGFVLGVADVVHVMALGSIIASGEPEAIVRDERVIEIYLGKQQ
jgi:branched-chain amino acid transport system ATP-binding protein